jgi:hypothetical protein
MHRHSKTYRANDASAKWAGRFRYEECRGRFRVDSLLSGLRAFHESRPGECHPGMNLQKSLR